MSYKCSLQRDLDVHGVPADRTRLNTRSALTLGHLTTAKSAIISNKSLAFGTVVEGTDTRGKAPLLDLESPASVWPPPRSGRDGAASAELEAPLLNPSKYPADLDSVSDDCFLDDINTQVGWFSMLTAASGAHERPPGFGGFGVRNVD